MSGSLVRREGTRNSRTRKSVEPQADRWEIVPGVAPYAVHSPYGRVLGRFGERQAAIAAMNQWPQAAFVLFAGDQIVDRKGGDA
jgi:hypothetical protein